ncbi:MAG: hypothetical protein ABFD89_17830 [Bryobacteraceae bacterium]
MIRSGSYTEEYFRGIGLKRVPLRLDTERIERLQAIELDWQCTRVEAVRRLIDGRFEQIRPEARSQKTRKQAVSRNRQGTPNNS